MTHGQTVCLLNDSFPPLIDGVANAVTNYAGVLQKSGWDPIVVTPSLPDADDSSFPYPVIRYPSMDLRKMTGYMAGIPFSPEVSNHLSDRKISLLHSHCPVVSTFLARELRQIADAPIVLTYHTKFDIDIANIMHSKALQTGSIHALVENISACDEVWAVSEGAAGNLRSLGYEGEIIVMPNGVDLPKGRVDDCAIEAAVDGYDLPSGVPVYLFVGRMMWYKGLRIVIDALTMMKQSGLDFRMVFVGSGADAEAIQKYAQQCGIWESCVFTGPIHDREILRAWYCRADLFLFPSTFDTNGLVVREAAACSLGAVLIRGSCAAEGVTDGRNGLLIEENAESLYHCLRQLYHHPDQMTAIGQNAADELYVSWDDAVAHAMERYEIVIDRYQSGAYPHHRTPLDEVWKANGELMEELGNLQHLRKQVRQEIQDHFDEVREHILETQDRIHNARQHVHDAIKHRS